MAAIALRFCICISPADYGGNGSEVKCATFVHLARRDPGGVMGFGLGVRVGAGALGKDVLGTTAGSGSQEISDRNLQAYA